MLSETLLPSPRMTVREPRGGRPRALMMSGGRVQSAGVAGVDNGVHVRLLSVGAEDSQVNDGLAGAGDNAPHRCSSLPHAPAEPVGGGVADADAVENGIGAAREQTVGGDEVFGVNFVLAGVYIEDEELAFVARLDERTDFAVIKGLAARRSPGA